MRNATKFPFVSLLIFWASIVVGESPEDYRFPRDCTNTDAGYPVPLCGKPLTKTPVVANDPESRQLRSYPEHFIPEQEELAPNEMRLTAVGSGNPPVRRGQASTSWLVELGNGIFSSLMPVVAPCRHYGVCGSPAFTGQIVPNPSSSRPRWRIFNLWDSMGWARNTPLHVYGASGATLNWVWRRLWKMSKGPQPGIQGVRPGSLPVEEWS